MIHPSYVDLMKVVNKDVEEGETPVINSRYSIVMATAKRARQIVDGDEPMIDDAEGRKPLSIAVEELEQQQLRILPVDESEIEKMEDRDLQAAKQMEEDLMLNSVASADEDDSQDSIDEEVTPEKSTDDDN